MEKFWEYFKENIIVQSLLTVMFGGTCCYLWLTKQDVPEALLGTTTLVLGYWFSKKNQHEIRQLVAQVKRGETE